MTRNVIRLCFSDAVQKSCQGCSRIPKEKKAKSFKNFTEKKQTFELL